MINLFFVVFSCFRFHVSSYPYVGTDDTALADCDASQNGGIGIDNNIVFQYRMAWDTLDGIAVLVEWETDSSQCDTLI